MLPLWVRNRVSPRNQNAVLNVGCAPITATTVIHAIDWHYLIRVLKDFYVGEVYAKIAFAGLVKLFGDVLEARRLFGLIVVLHDLLVEELWLRSYQLLLWGFDRTVVEKWIDDGLFTAICNYQVLVESARSLRLHFHFKRDRHALVLPLRENWNRTTCFL